MTKVNLANGCFAILLFVGMASYSPALAVPQNVDPSEFYRMKTNLEFQISTALRSGSISANEAHQFRTDLSRITDTERQYESTGNAVTFAQLDPLLAEVTSIETNLNDTINTNNQRATAMSALFDSQVNNLQDRISYSMSNKTLSANQADRLQGELQNLASLRGGYPTLVTDNLSRLSGRLDQLNSRIEMLSSSNSSEQNHDARYVTFEQNNSVTASSGGSL